VRGFGGGCAHGVLKGEHGFALAKQERVALAVSEELHGWVSQSAIGFEAERDAGITRCGVDFGGWRWGGILLRNGWKKCKQCEC